MSSVLIHHYEVGHHHESTPGVKREKTFEAFSDSPVLPCLPLHLYIFKWTLQTTPDGAREPASAEHSELDPARPRYRLHPELILFPLGVECLINSELR